METVSDRISKIGLHLLKLWSKVKCNVFRHTVYAMQFAQCC